MIYNSIVPSEMTQRELKAICADIQIAKNWNLPYATVQLKNGMEYKVDVERHSDYQKEFKTVTGAIPRRGVGL